VLNITTRGSPEAIIVLIVVACFACLRTADVLGTGTRDHAAREAWAAVLFALAVSFKIYPVIYTPTIWALLRARHGLFGKGVWQFGVITAMSLACINGALWLM
jgi:phosphatidylinositol glycan class M